MQDFRAPEEFFVTPDLASCGERSSFIQSATQKLGNDHSPYFTDRRVDQRFTVTFQLLLLLDLFFRFSTDEWTRRVHFYLETIWQQLQLKSCQSIESLKHWKL